MKFFFMKKQLVQSIGIILVALLVSFLARMGIVNLLIAIGAGVWMLVITWKPFFGTSEEFEKSLGYSFTPDIFSLFSGKLLEDWGYSYLLSFWLFTGIGLGIGIYFLLNYLFISP